MVIQIILWLRVNKAAIYIWADFPEGGYSLESLKMCSIFVATFWKISSDISIVLFRELCNGELSLEISSIRKSSPHCEHGL